MMLRLGGSVFGAEDGQDLLQGVNDAVGFGGNQLLGVVVGTQLISARAGLGAAGQ